MLKIYFQNCFTLKLIYLKCLQGEKISKMFALLKSITSKSFLKLFYIKINLSKMFAILKSITSISFL